MSRKHHAIRWDSDIGNVQVQCPKCNLFGQGEQYTFGKLLDIRIDDGTADKLKELSRTTIKFMRCDYEELIEKYKEKVNALKSDLS